MTEATLIFPHQLFANHPAIKKDRRLYCIEEPLFFGDHHYPAVMHKQKLVLHRASMKHFATQHEKAIYIEYANATTVDVFKRLRNDGTTKLFIIDPTDDILRKRLRKASAVSEIKIEWLENPNFLTTPQEYRSFFEDKKRYHQTDFYIYQRKRLDLMIDDRGPWGGHWTFDTENRRKLPKDIDPPEPLVLKRDKFVEEAKEYVERHFPNNYGDLKAFNYPVTHKQAEQLLDYFLEKQLPLFGPYQDALSQRSDFLFHSKLSAPLNIGLLDPSQVVNRAIQYGVEHQIPLSSLEGFVRQIIGWREFFRAIYELEGVSIRNTNTFSHTNPLTERWYEGKLGIPPVDDVIHKLLKYGYAHHIERLMVLGNFMLLCEIDPQAIYKWFMELFIDSYDWVMVPNVYSMSQYADGGKIVTKPYISGSNYILKMSDYKKGDWCPIWDGLYWRFLEKNRSFLEPNPRMKMVYNLLNKMESTKLKDHISIADDFIQSIK